MIAMFPTAETSPKIVDVLMENFSKLSELDAKKCARLMVIVNTSQCAMIAKRLKDPRVQVNSCQRLHDVVLMRASVVLLSERNLSDQRRRRRRRRRRRSAGV